MQRSHLTLWLALVALLWGTQCNSLSDDCKKTLTCANDAGAPRLNLRDCTWRFPDGGVWEDGPQRNTDGTWSWPNGEPAPTFECRGLMGSGGASDNCTTAETPAPDEVRCDPRHCDTASGDCVDCLNNTHCAAQADADENVGRVCDPDSHRCVTCRNDTDCAGTGTPYCQQSPTDATLNKCVQCLRDADCGGTEVCDEPTGECTLRCARSSECPESKPVCSIPSNATEGVCVECEDNSTCSGGTPECNPTTKDCVQCVGDIPCVPLGRVCDPEANQCVRCTDNAHCQELTETPRCDVPTHACVECLDHSDCENVAESRCNTGTHTCEVCTQDEQCENGAKCRLTDGRCVQCLEDTHCTGGGNSRCEETSGTCVECLGNADCPLVDAARCDLAPASGTRFQCVGCTGFAECAGKGGLCRVNGGICVSCLGNADCTSTGGAGLSRCDVETGSCAACANDSDCDLVANLRACRTAAVNPGCVECVNNSHCVGNADGPRCKTATGGGPAPINTCVECLTNADCTDPAESLCQNNTCVPCTQNGQCSHIANRGVCDTSQGAGVCVQCTGANRTACGANVCNSLTRLCTNLGAGTANLCDECVSDDHCAGTQLCVQQEFDDSPVGFFCFARQGTGGCGDRPYALSIPGAVSIDGQGASICGLALTTCPALDDFEVAAACGTAAAPNSALCGDPDLDDGVCLPVGAQAFCSIPCGGSALNCTGGACQAQVCALQ